MNVIAYEHGTAAELRNIASGVSSVLGFTSISFY